VRANLPQENGVIHIINRIILEVPAREDDEKLDGAESMAPFYAGTFLFLILVSFL
jgi:hypothetical protein